MLEKWKVLMKVLNKLVNVLKKRFIRVECVELVDETVGLV